MMGGHDHQLPFPGLPLLRDSLEDLHQPLLLRETGNSPRDESWIFGGVGVETEDVHEWSVQEPIRPWQRHRLAKDRSGNRRNFLSGRAEVRAKGPERLRVRLGNRLPVRSEE